MGAGDENHNPGNIRPGTFPWVGQTGTDPRGYCIFDTWANGVRAMARTLQAYQQVHDCCTVNTIIKRWAPSSENDTQAYVTDVCQRSGYSPDEWINTRDRAQLTRLMLAMIHHELGHDLAQSDFDAGMALVFA